jgi:hypothetical protein
MAKNHYHPAHYCAVVCRYNILTGARATRRSLTRFDRGDGAARLSRMSARATYLGMGSITHMRKSQAPAAAFRYACGASARTRRASEAPHCAISPATSTVSSPRITYRNSCVPSGWLAPANDSVGANVQRQSSPPTSRTRAASISMAALPAGVFQNSFPDPDACRTTLEAAAFSYRSSAKPTLSALAIRQRVAIEGLVRRCSIWTSIPLLNPDTRAKASSDSPRDRRNLAQFEPTESIMALSSTRPEAPRLWRRTIGSFSARDLRTPPPQQQRTTRFAFNHFNGTTAPFQDRRRPFISRESRA